MDKATKEDLEPMLRKLGMVSWDRYVNPADGEYWFYGWIDREDEHKDFVVLSRVGEWWWYLTSSEKYSQEISDIIHGESAPHSPCIRVEAEFDIPNMIKL